MSSSRTGTHAGPRILNSFADKTGFYLLSLCAVLSPIPYGSNNAIAAGLIGIVLAACLLGTSFASAPHSSKAQRLLDSTIVLCAILIVWTSLQTVVLHATVTHSAISRDTGSAIAAEPPAFLRLQPLYSLGYAIIPLTAFASALFYIRDTTRFMTFLHILTGGAAVITTLCIAEYALSPLTLLLQPKGHYLSSFTGPFVNPNTAATYFGILLLLSVSVGLRYLQKIRRYKMQIRTPAQNADVRMFVIYAILTVIFSLALFLTRSRGGILSSLAGVLLLTSAFGFSTRSQNVSCMRLFATGTLAAVVTLTLFALYGGLTLERLNVEGFDDGGRICTYRQTWQIINDNLWFGAGLGTFQDVFPQYRLPECGFNGYWEMAHSVFLEGWLSLGVIFFPCLVIIYYQLVSSYLYGLRTRRRYRFVSLAALTILVLLTLHSLIDFSLQIPAVAVVAAIVLGACSSVSLAPAGASSRRPL